LYAEAEEVSIACVARARVVKGNISAARSAYQDFFARWKEADPDIPILKEAKAEYAELQ
jgi:hypothetical protein